MVRRLSTTLLFSYLAVVLTTGLMSAPRGLDFQTKLKKLGNYRVLSRLENLSEELIKQSEFTQVKAHQPKTRELRSIQAKLHGKTLFLPRPTVQTDPVLEQEQIMDRLQTIYGDLGGSGTSTARLPLENISHVLGNPFGDDYDQSRKMGRLRSMTPVTELDSRMSREMMELSYQTQKLQAEFADFKSGSVSDWNGALHFSGFFDFQYDRRRFHGQSFLTKAEETEFCIKHRVPGDKNNCTAVFVDLGRFDNSRLVLDFDSELSSRMEFHSRLMFEHGGSELSLPEAYVDYFIDDDLGVRAGMMLVPFGRYNRFFDGPLRTLSDIPAVNDFIIPVPWYDSGVGLIGAYKIRSCTLDFEAYIMNGLSDSSFTLDRNSGLQNLKRNGLGSLEVGDDDKAVVARLGLDLNSTQLGFSYYEADVGQYNDTSGENPTFEGKRPLRLLGVDLERSFANQILWTLEYAQGTVDPDDFEVDVLKAAGKDLSRADYNFMGWYTQVDVPLFSDERYKASLRIGEVDTRKNIDNSGDIREQVLGISYRPDKKTVYRLEQHFETLNHKDDANKKNQNGVVLGVATYF
jgi:hypothetical protein